MNTNTKIKKDINSLLNSTLKEKGIKILFAVETGSRLWRIESKDSDFDMRFVFVRETRDYLRIHKLQDVIEVKKGDIDIVGFDIYKFLHLLLNSNPSVIEWLYSDIIYFDDKKTKSFLRNFIQHRFNPVALYSHYRSMCKQNYIKYLKTGESMTHKKYLYCMRGLINALYVEKFNNIPPIDFTVAIEDVKKFIPLLVYNKLKEILKLKKDGFENIKISKIHLFERYIEDFLSIAHNIEGRKILDYSKLQDYVYSLLL